MPSTAHEMIGTLQTDDWISATKSSGCAATVRGILLRCAEFALPYWESRFQQDDTMAGLVSAIRDYVDGPANDTLNALKLLASDHQPQPLPFFSPVFEKYSAPDCGDSPADVAGDAITYSALAIANRAPVIDESHLESALENTCEVVARLLAERDPDDDSSRDFRGEAEFYVKNKLLIAVQRESEA